MTDSDVGNHEHSITDDIVFSEPMYLLKQGRKVYWFKGDGNCMYRISYLMTNDQKNYPSLKLLEDFKTSIKAYSVSYSITSVNKQTFLHI